MSDRHQTTDTSNEAVERLAALLYDVRNSSAWNREAAATLRALLAERDAARAEVSALVEAARREEREAAAKVSEECDLPWNSPTDEQHDHACAMADRIAAAIRARGDA